MKKIFSFVFAFVIALSALPISAMAASHTHNLKTGTTADSSLDYTYCTNPTDKTVAFSLQTYPESSHNYSNNADQSFSYSVPNASSLEIKFSDKCLTEKDYDIVTVIDANNKTVGSYSGSELACEALSQPLTDRNGIPTYTSRQPSQRR